ncbi:MAG TPA: hypothetical protein VMS64_10890 [Candidatus Methylomirabilis sp.]|nr:hypothetical protein [Candidatus Methylomirabilis sp.]
MACRTPNRSSGGYAVRLHEGGMIKTAARKLIAQSTEWRFLNELKNELKG